MERKYRYIWYIVNRYTSLLCKLFYFSRLKIGVIALRSWKSIKSRLGGNKVNKISLTCQPLSIAKFCFSSTDKEVPDVSKHMCTLWKKVLPSAYFWCFNLSQIDDYSVSGRTKWYLEAPWQAYWGPSLYLWQAEAPKIGAWKYFFS